MINDKMEGYKEIKELVEFENICNSNKKIHLYTDTKKIKMEIYIDTIYMNYHDLVFFCLRHSLQNDTHLLQRESKNMVVNYHKYHVLDLDIFRYFVSEKDDYFELFEIEKMN